MKITPDPLSQSDKTQEIDPSKKESQLSIFFITFGNPFFLFYTYNITSEEFPGTELSLISLYFGLLCMHEFFSLYKTEPMSIKTLMHPICAIALIFIVYKTQIPLIEKIISHYKVIELNEKACGEGDNLACYKIASSALRIEHKRHAFKYFSKACALEHQGACSWIRDN